MSQEAPQSLLELYQTWSGSPAEKAEMLPPSGSNRQYFRLHGKQTVIGAINPDQRENDAFIYLSNHFAAKQLPVPKVLAISKNRQSYLISDLGDTTLFSLLPHNQPEQGISPQVKELYIKSIESLVKFQTQGAQDLDVKYCYPRHSFDRQSMSWDLNYFKYYFLKVSGIAFDEQLLENDFNRLMDALLQVPSHYFMYRDFQSRNIMVVDGQPWFIDHQGGRQGPLAYDLASLLYDAKANLPVSFREELLSHYEQTLEAIQVDESKTFRQTFYGFVLIRILQALGSYGFRGGVEGKPLFLQSVPYALNNLRHLIENNRLPSQTPYLNSIVEQMTGLRAGYFLPSRTEKLNINISSFSYKRGIPQDPSGNGGGFVFDCRILPNPGREPKYQPLTGLDKEVIDYLKTQTKATAFYQHAESLILQGIEDYLERGFSHLMVSFGCTGGQHRSVYCATKLFNKLKDDPRIRVTLTHHEKGNWPKKNTPAS